jgi:NAD(P)-dependent dehydrogenase (short-subunit alcohol dehydrogenase family)
MNTAVITGASTGIGKAVALEMARANYHVFLVARRKKALLEIQERIQEHGGTTTMCVADLSKTESVMTLIEDIKRQTNSIELIANIAGIWHGEQDVYAGKEYQTFDSQVILDTLSVGVIAPSILVHGLLPLMHAGSKIINLSGTFENGAKGWLPYYVSKRAIEDLTVGLSQELLEKDIQVNCISPSDTATESYAKFFPQYMEDAIDPTEIAKKFVELSRPEDKTTGKVIVMKKGNEPVEAFHS